MKISIITPTYNSEKFIKDTLESIASQTYKNVEHIICDNLSTDKTLEICKLYSNIIISKHDNSMYEAINTGIIHSSGDILCFLNSDDLFPHSKILENIICFFRKNSSADVLYGKCMMVDRNLNYLYSHSPKKQLNYKMAINRLFVVSHPSVFLRKNIFLKYGLYDISYRLMADCEYWIRILKNDVKFHYTPETLSVFRLHDSNLSGSGTGDKEAQLILQQYNVSRPALYSKLYLAIDNLFNFRYLCYLVKRFYSKILEN